MNKLILKSFYVSTSVCASAGLCTGGVVGLIKNKDISNASNNDVITNLSPYVYMLGRPIFGAFVGTIIGTGIGITYPISIPALYYFLKIDIKRF